MGCHNSWANLRCLSCSPLRGKSLWNGTIASGSCIDYVTVTPCFHLKLYQGRLGINCMISLYLKLHEGSKYKWTVIFFNGEYYQRLNSCPWFHVFLVSWLKTSVKPWIVLYVMPWLTGPKRRAQWQIMSLISLSLSKCLTCNGMSLDSWYCENMNKYCYGTGGNNQYRNLQAEVYFEVTRFLIARDQCLYPKCAGYAPCSWC